MPENVTIENEISNAAQHTQDVNSETIFSNNELVSQLLRSYSEMPIFSDVHAEDIVDVTQKYQAFLGVGFEADRVKKVRIRTGEKDQNTKEEKIKEIYVIPLIEHKSKVEYDVAFQLLRYMVVIWYDYAKKYEEQHKNKSFRYPLIVPVVYYEGTQKWTADMNFADRIENIEGMTKYIPDFEYKVISCSSYTNEELQRKHDEMSVIMMLNRIQTPEEFHKFLSTPQEYLEEILGEAPKDIKKIIIDVFWALMMKIGVPTKEAQEAVANMEANRMGILFEHAEKMDIKEERRKTAEAIKRADEEKNRADKAENRADEAENRADEAENRADEEKSRADKAENRADEEKSRADEEKSRADIAENRADEEKSRADKAEERANVAEQFISNLMIHIIQKEKNRNHTKAEAIQILKEKYHLPEQAEELVEQLW